MAQIQTTLISFPTFYKKYKTQLSMGREKMRALTKLNGFPIVKKGKTTLINEREVDNWIANYTKKEKIIFIK